MTPLGSTQYSFRVAECIPSSTSITETTMDANGPDRFAHVPLESFWSSDCFYLYCIYSPICGLALMHHGNELHANVCD